MNYVITGSLGNISKLLVQKLIAAKNNVTVISSMPEKKSEIEALGAHAAIGSVENEDFLTKTFQGVDAVYTMVPPNFGASNWKQFIANIGKNYAEAIKAAGVKNVVNLSSIGAHMPEGCGPVSGIHYVEGALNALEGVNVKHLRPGYFYNNFLGNIGMIKHAGIIGGNYDEKTKMLLVAPADIAEVAAEELLNLSFKDKSIRYIVSDERTTEEAAQILGKAIGKPDLKWIGFSDEEAKAGMVQGGLPVEVANNYIEMGQAIRSGEMSKEYYEHRPAQMEKTKLESFAKVFASIYAQS